MDGIKNKNLPGVSTWQIYLGLAFCMNCVGLGLGLLGGDYLRLRAKTNLFYGFVLFHVSYPKILHIIILSRISVDISRGALARKILLRCRRSRTDSGNEKKAPGHIPPFPVVSG